MVRAGDRDIFESRPRASGWIDWTHADVSGDDLVRTIKDRQTGTWGWTPLPVSSGEEKPLLGGRIRIGSYTTRW